MKNDFLKSALQQFKYYQQLGTASINQVPEEKLFWQFNSDSNSIAIIVKHLKGNMLSRWTDFMTTDGEKEWRKREEEFENNLPNKEALLKAWNEGWDCVFEAVEPLRTEDLEKIIYIRNQGHSVTEAINRQLCHYSYHVGQMVFLGKMICGEEWQSLSIPKGDSKKYNAEKFNQEKEKKHFTDEYLNNEKS